MILILITLLSLTYGAGYITHLIWTNPHLYGNEHRLFVIYLDLMVIMMDIIIIKSLII